MPLSSLNRPLPLDVHHLETAKKHGLFATSDMELDQDACESKWRERAARRTADADADADGEVPGAPDVLDTFESDLQASKAVLLDARIADEALQAPERFDS